MNEPLPPAAKGIVALYCLFGDISWLSQSYQSIYPCVEKIMFFLSSSPWYGDEHSSRIDLDRLRHLSDPQGKVEIIQGDWKDECEQRNTTLAYAIHDGFSYGFIVDADEIYESSQLLRGLEYARSQPETSVWHVEWYTYWKSSEYRIEPIDPYQPNILIKLGDVGFVETRNALGSLHNLIPPEICMCHHMSYALTDEGLRAKHIMQPNHSQTAYPGWYDQKWKGWDLDHSIENLHPVTPEWFRRAVKQPREALPSILRELPNPTA